MVYEGYAAVPDRMEPCLRVSGDYSLLEVRRRKAGANKSGGGRYFPNISAHSRLYVAPPCLQTACGGLPPPPNSVAPFPCVVSDAATRPQTQSASSPRARRRRPSVRECQMSPPRPTPNGRYPRGARHPRRYPRRTPQAGARAATIRRAGIHP
jgi:hypothetical protein